MRIRPYCSFPLCETHFEMFQIQNTANQPFENIREVEVLVTDFPSLEGFVRERSSSGCFVERKMPGEKDPLLGMPSGPFKCVCLGSRARSLHGFLNAYSEKRISLFIHLIEHPPRVGQKRRPNRRVKLPESIQKFSKRILFESENLLEQVDANFVGIWCESMSNEHLGEPGWMRALIQLRVSLKIQRL